MGELEGRPLVLVVDDNEDQLVMFEALLELAGYEVVAASSVAMAGAVIAAASRDVDVLIADMSLGDGSAHDVMALLRQRGHRPRVAVVVTGYDAREDVERTLAAGFDAHLCKPASANDLLEVLAKGLRHRPSGIRVTDACEPRRPARAFKG